MNAPKTMKHMRQHARWAKKYSDLGLADDAARAAVMAVRFYFLVHPERRDPVLIGANNGN